MKNGKSNKTIDHNHEYNLKTENQSSKYTDSNNHANITTIKDSKLSIKNKHITNISSNNKNDHHIDESDIDERE